jgi:hypothetical protein
MSMQRSKLLWLCPLAGGAAAAAFLTLRLLPHDQALFFFTVAFVRDSLANYVLALPLLFFARWLGLKHVLVYGLISILSALPLGWMLSHPIPYAWDWTEADFAHGPYWFVLSGYMFCSVTTGLLFGIIDMRSNNSFKPNPLRSFKTPSGSSGGSA